MMGETTMGRIRDLIDSKKNEVEHRCFVSAKHIIKSDDFISEIEDALDNNESSVSVVIDDILSDSNLIHDQPSDSEWELIIEEMTSMLEDESVRVTNHGWKYDADRDCRDYLIYLAW